MNSCTPDNTVAITVRDGHTTIRGGDLIDPRDLAMAAAGLLELLQQTAGDKGKNLRKVIRLLQKDYQRDKAISFSFARSDAERTIVLEFPRGDSVKIMTNKDLKPSDLYYAGVGLLSCVPGSEKAMRTLGFYGGVRSVVQ